MLITYFKTTAEFSRTILGKLIAICVIIFYTCIDILYGLFVCALTILYYQSEFIENMLNWSSSDTVSVVDEVDDPLYIGGIMNQNLEPFMEIENAYADNNVRSVSEFAEQFKKTHCLNDKLMNKDVPVRLDMTEHVYSEVKFDNAPCNVCSKTCGFSITDSKIRKEHDMKPIYSKNL
jgi:hypothetical protein